MAQPGGPMFAHLLMGILYEGPSLFADRRAIRLDVDFGRLNRVALGDLPQAMSFLSEIFAAGSSEAISAWSAVPLPEAVARLAVALQRHLGHDVEFVAALPGDRSGVTHIVYGYHTPVVGLMAGRTAVTWINAALGPGEGGPGKGRSDGPVPDARISLAAFASAVAPWRLTATTERIADEADRRGIPWFRIHRGMSIIQLGQGCHQQRFRDAVTGSIPVLGWEIAASREVAAALLGGAGIPIPAHRPVDDAEAAVEAARSLGYPVVMKPAAMDNRTGVHLGLRDDEAVREAFHKAGRLGRVLVERQLTGKDHHLLVVRGHMIAAALSTGGTSEDVTGRVHPVNRVMAERAARIVGLDLVGIGFITPVIAKPYYAAGGGVCEIDPRPDLRPHLGAAEPSRVVGALLDGFFPRPADGRIPVAAITGTNGKTTTCRMVAAMLRAEGHIVGLATTDDVIIGDADIGDADMAGPAGARVVLRDPRVTAAVLETARGGIIKHGLGFDQCDVGAVLNIDDDHIGMDGIATFEAMARVKGLVTGAARHLAVLNADDPLCRALRSSTRARHICWVTEREETAELRRHIEARQPAVVLAEGPRGPAIRLWVDGEATHVVDIGDIPATFGGTARINAVNALYAVAVAHGLGITPAVMRETLRGFASDAVQSPGRLNLYEDGPFRIVVDHAGNATALRQLKAFLATLPVAGRRSIVLNTAGDRRDDHFGKVAAAVAGAFDSYVCTTGLPQGRGPGEVARLLAAGLIKAGVTAAAIVEREPDAAAIDHALEEARPGDLLVILSLDSGRIAEQLAKGRYLSQDR